MKRLYKSRKEKMIDGVCGGIAEYFDIDPVLVRIIFVLFFFIGGSAVIAYIVGMIIMPRKPLDLEASDTGGGDTPSKTTAKPVQQEAPVGAAGANNKGSLILGIILLVIGSFFLMGNFNFFSGFYWWFRSHFWDFLIPGVLIVTGIVVIAKGFEK